MCITLHVLPSPYEWWNSQVLKGVTHLLDIRNAYNMVINKFGDRLYSGLVETETAHLRGIAAKVAHQRPPAKSPSTYAALQKSGRGVVHCWI